MKMVDREKIIKKLEDYSTDSICTKCAYYNVHCIGKLCADTLKLLKEQTEQKHGHWIRPLKFLSESQCSVCKETYVGDYRTFNHCPRCGAKMDRMEAER